MSTVNNNREHFDVVVIGCGPSGSTLAAYLARAGLSVLTLEKQQFPRYQIGESLTGMATEVLNEFDLGPEMDRRLFPPKGGVKVIGHGAKSEFFVPVLNPTWQVRRDEFDQILLDNAIEHGATHRYGTVKKILRDGKKVIGVSYLPQNGSELKDVFCRVVADASGRAAVLSRQGVAGSVAYLDDFSRQTALFSQFKDARRDPDEMGDNTFIFYSQTHHWGWFIPISPDVVSVGIVIPGSKVKECGGAEEAYAWGLEHINPDLGWRVEGCERVEKVRAITNYSYTIDPFVGDGWLCVGDAHGFIDPIFSFGASFALVEARAASQAILAALDMDDDKAPFSEYSAFCKRGQDVAFDLIRYFWKFPIFFGYQTRGKLRNDFIRLLASDCHSPREIRMVEIMRKALQKFDSRAALAAA